jgi:hypothetical protein
MPARLETTGKESGNSTELRAKAQILNMFFLQIAP